MPTTYLCGEDCPANPGAWELHGVFHKKLRKQQKKREDGGATQQRDREIAERQARIAALTGDEYSKLLAEGTRYSSKDDFRRAAKAYREAIALKPDQPIAYANLGVALSNSGHIMEAAQRYLEAKERFPMGSELWADATAAAFDKLWRNECAEVAKPDWWNDEGLKALSARVVRASPNNAQANQMRANVLCGQCGAWEARPRSAAELKEAVVYYGRTAALISAPLGKAEFAGCAAWCRSQAAAM